MRQNSEAGYLVPTLIQPDKVNKLEMNGVIVSPDEETGLDPFGPPVIGLALSFPTSESATRVEYQVTKRWNKTLVDDGDSDDD